MTCLLEWKETPSKDDGSSLGAVDPITGNIVDLSAADPYTQWLFGPGRDHRLTNLLEPKAPEDFAYVDVIKNLDDPRSGETIEPLRQESLLRSYLRLDAPTLLGDGDNAPPDDKSAGNPLIAPLPIRKSSLASKPRGSIKKPVYEVPKGIDPGKVVIVGIIDDSINIIHSRFLAEDGSSRVDYAWVQDAPGTMQKSDIVTFGREWDRAGIEAAMAKHGHNEAAILRALHFIGEGTTDRYNPLSERISHGTHIADLAAGGSDVNSRIIAVQLPVIASHETSGIDQLACVRYAAAFIYQRALTICKELKQPVPVVLNFSYGFTSGGRGGKDLINRILDTFQRAYLADSKKASGKSFGAPFVTVLPVSNNHLTRSHVIGNQPFRGQHTLDCTFRTQPADQTCNYLEFWMPQGVKSAGIGITPPGCEETVFDLSSFGSGNVQPSTEFGVRFFRVFELSRDLCRKSDGAVVGRLTLDAPNPIINNDAAPFWRLLLCLSPSRSTQGAAVAPAGLWRLRIDAEDTGNSGRIHGWILRDEKVSGSRVESRQAYFEDAAYDESLFDPIGDIDIRARVPGSCISRDGTLAASAVAKDGSYDVSVGATVWSTGAAAVYSAAGFGDSPADRGAAFVAAPADTSRVLPGILAAGSRSGSAVALNGTSVAAPQITRSIVSWMQDTPLDQRENFSAPSAFQTRKGPLATRVPDRPTNLIQETPRRKVIRFSRLTAGSGELEQARDASGHRKRAVTEQRG